MSPYASLLANLVASPRRWLVTGAAGFIGSHLVETLLRLGQTVRALDNFATGRRENLVGLQAVLTLEEWARFTFIEGDLRDPEDCRQACDGAELILHQGALGSVPRSIDNPLASHESNVTGTLNLLGAARDAGIQRFVYASSSSVYGDDPNLPKVEDRTGRVLSPYAATKMMIELYAGVFARCYGLKPVGLRYFNVFGARQDPEGAYAAVIPKWVSAMLRHEPVLINGDGETSRDFCYIANVVQANLLAAVTENPDAIDQAYNVAVHHRTTLNELFARLKQLVEARTPGLQVPPPVYRDFRAGDVRHSLADISKARGLLGYEPTHQLDEGLAEAIDWYCENVTAS
jgi:UDP-N-acetylglucosamine 4-epimerase